MRESNEHCSPEDALMVRIAEKVEIDFTDEVIRGSGGSIFLSRMSEHLGIPELLEESLKLKERRRGSSDVETMLSPIYCFAQGDESLVDVDRLRADYGGTLLLGLEDVPGPGRLEEYLFRFDGEAAKRFEEDVA